MESLTANGRIWIELNNKSLAGSGKMQLLNAISHFGSLRQAAMEMKMSYRQAWYSIQKINLTSDKPMVILKRGGKKGGMAEVTPYGKEIIAIYNRLEIRFHDFLKEQNRELNQSI